MKLYLFFVGFWFLGAIAGWWINDKVFDYVTRNMDDEEILEALRQTIEEEGEFDDGEEK